MIENEAVLFVELNTTPVVRSPMRLVVCVLVSLLCAFRTASASDLELTHARVYTAPDLPPIPDGAILIHDGKIVAVGPASSVKPPRRAQNLTVVNCTGMTVTAGLWNSHVHILTPPLLHAEHKSPAELQTELERLFTRWGFTTVFDIASVLANTSLIRHDIETRVIKGPRILTVGEPFWTDTPVYVRAFLAANHVSIPEAHSVPEAVARVDSETRSGADAIKIFAGVIEPDSVQVMPLDLAKAIVTEAHHDGKLVFAHPSNQAGIEISLASGVDILAHTTPTDGPWPADLPARLLAAHMSLIPTLTLFDLEAQKADATPERTKHFLDLAVAQLRAFHSAGGNILFGTDVGYTDRPDTSEEFTLMSQAGMSFAEILASLTTNPAQRFGYAAHSGRIAPAMDADLTVFKTDPAADITALSRVAYTIRNGAVIFSVH